jgi:GNAT superfamily N-acetyltransferase
MSDTEALLAVYDRELRREISYPGMRREVTPTVIRHIGERGDEATVLYSQLDERSADAAIQEQIAYFGGLGLAFEWKAFAHDAPADLVQRLSAHGFEVEQPPDAIMALDLERAPAALFTPITHDIRRIDDPAQMPAVLRIQEEVWNEDRAGLAERLAADLRADPDQLSVYMAYIDGVAASSAWIYFHPATQFASLWGGSTLPAYRKRGLYHALLAVRAQLARARGVRYLTVDASPMSRPILESSGFHVLTQAWACLWHPAVDAVE